MPRRRAAALALLVLLAPLGSAAAQTPEQWVAMGKQVHGGFGTFIVLGIRIGQDALKVLGAQPRQVDVTLASGPKAPCPCLVDGVLIATSASPGQGTLRVAAEKAADDQLGVLTIRHRTTGAAVRYVVPAAIGPKLAAWNRELDDLARFAKVMGEPEAGLFTRELLPAAR